MRILAIRGRNLASLAGDFAVELGTAPLSETGLFAITGPTGAGKTTLLDALCLALFDRTPRLATRAGTGVRVGLPGESEALRLFAHDVRSLLRKGTASGHAEVDFAGNDGKVYRARWSVRRARDRVDGQLQDQSMSLQLAGSTEPIGRTKSEILGLIEQKLGLSFEQFRRSALLAQGEFAAFLRASEKERAELLEQMTGTWVYGEVSMRAFERARAEQRRLEELESRLGEVRLLGDARRTEIEAERLALEARVDHAHHTLAALDAARARLAAGEQLASQVRDAEQDLSLARAEWTGSEAERSDLARHLQALALTEPLRHLDAAEQSVREITLQQAHRQQKCAAAVADEARLAAARLAAEQEITRARHQLAEAEPFLQQATEIDHAILAESERLRDAGREAQLGDEAARQAEAAAAALRDEQTRLESGSLAARNALAAAPEVAHLAPQWEPSYQQLLRYHRTTKAAARLDLPAATARAEQARQDAERAERFLDEASEQAQLAQAQASAAEQEAGRFDLAGLRVISAGLLRQESSLGSLVRVVEDAARLAAQIRAATDASSVALARSHAEEQIAARAGHDRSHAEARQSEARAALTRMRNALDLGHRRPELLTAGEPCPLCGATEHPWADRSPAISAMVEEQEQEVNRWTAALKQLEREEISAAHQARDLARQSADQAALVVSLGQQLAEIQQRWSQAAGGEWVLPSSPTDDGAAQALAVAQARCGEALDEVRRSEQQADEAARTARRARDALEQARASAEHARTGRDDTRKLAEDLATALAQTGRDLARLTAEQGEILEELAPAFERWTGWREQIRGNITAFGALCRDAVTRHQEHQKSLAELEVSLRDTSPEAARAAAQATERRALARARQQAAQSIETSLGRLQTARRGLLDGVPVERVQHRLQGAIQAAEEASRQAVAAHEAAMAQVAKVQGQLLASEDARQKLETAAAQAAAALDEPLVTLGVDLPELRRLVRVDRAQLTARQARFDALGHRLERLETVVVERRERLVEHEAAGPPPVDPAFLDVAEREGRARLREDEDTLAQLRVALRDDEREQTRAGGLRGEIEAQRARSDLWGSVGQLIGAADGKKFRVFAQSLTFDSLIALANAHLDDLARRYQLMRVPGTDLDLQVVDREMADEARSTASLSGGESFLVSLALALGLSSLGSRDARVDTLFIDEGFGSLDQESLEVALAALDALQESGRQVGVISHVPGLPERLGVHVRVQPRGAGRSVVVVGKTA